MKLIAKLLDMLPLKPSALAVYAMLIQLVYVVVFHLRPSFDTARSANPSDVAGLIIGFVTIFLLAQVWDLLFSFQKQVRLAADWFLITSIVCVYSYHYNTRFFLDYSVMADNAGIVFSRKSLEVIITTFDRTSISIALGILLVLVAIELRKKYILFPIKQSQKFAKTISGILIYIILSSFPLPTYDGLGYLLQTVKHYYSPSSLKPAYTEGSYPFVKEKLAADKRVNENGEKPHIFLILIESFNAGFVESKSPEGNDYLPFCNRIITQGIYAQNFYGNSVQTCKGHFATFFSMIPGIRGKVYEDFSKTHFRSVAQILKENGYRTLFMQGHEDITFDNTESFLKNNGFDTVGSIYPFLSKDDLSQIWGWGPEDGVLYQRLFEYIDEQPHDKPIFAAIATIANHMRFDQMPPSKKIHYKNPRSAKEKYANSIALSDRDLQLFFDELAKRPQYKNAVVIITGDHSFPVGEHGIEHNEVCYFEAKFKIPFLMVGPGIKPRRLTTAYSQVDIAPTILDAAGIRAVKNHFIGVSMLSQHHVPDAVYLVQPYNGRYLSVIIGAMKYVWHAQTQEELLFNLALDPDEQHNIIDQRDDHSLAPFREGLKFVMLNQYLLEHDKVWPQND